MTPFAYPQAAHERQHGPQGYANYSEYRDWVRDEFAFRCVFCLWREVWWGSSTAFHLDHAAAQKDEPDMILVYENLVYLCTECNLKKQARPLVDPCSVTFTATVPASKALPVRPI